MGWLMTLERSERKILGKKESVTEQEKKSEQTISKMNLDF